MRRKLVLGLIMGMSVEDVGNAFYELVRKE